MKIVVTLLLGFCHVSMAHAYECKTELKYQELKALARKHNLHKYALAQIDGMGRQEAAIIANWYRDVLDRAAHPEARESTFCATVETHSARALSP